jgi:hypothetical protein
MKCFQCGILFLAVAGFLSSRAAAQSPSLVVERHGDYLHVAAPQLHFLEGRALQKLHDGATVIYVFTLTATAEHAHTPAIRLKERFAISFDLWEERYSVVRIGSNNRSASRLTATSAEAWCLDNMPVPVQAIPTQRSFMLRLECSVDESNDEDGDKNGPKPTLTGLIDIFSRKKSEGPLRWEATAGPLNLSELKSVK